MYFIVVSNSAGVEVAKADGDPFLLVRMIIIVKPQGDLQMQIVDGNTGFFRLYFPDFQHVRIDYSGIAADLFPKHRVAFFEVTFIIVVLEMVNVYYIFHSKNLQAFHATNVCGEPTVNVLINQAAI